MGEIFFPPHRSLAFTKRRPSFFFNAATATHARTDTLGAAADECTRGGYCACAKPTRASPMGASLWRGGRQGLRLCCSRVERLSPTCASLWRGERGDGTGEVRLLSERRVRRYSVAVAAAGLPRSRAQKKTKSERNCSRRKKRGNGRKRN